MLLVCFTRIRSPVNSVSAGTHGTAPHETVLNAVITSSHGSCHQGSCTLAHVSPPITASEGMPRCSVCVRMADCELCTLAGPRRHVWFSTSCSVHSAARASVSWVDGFADRASQNSAGLPAPGAEPGLRMSLGFVFQTKGICSA